MSVIVWLVVGMIIGFIGNKIDNQSGKGVLLDVMLGIAGALAGGYLFTIAGTLPLNVVSIGSTVMAAVGAIVVLVDYHAVIGRRALR